MGVDDDENELSMMDFIHCFVETLDWHFGNVCELDIMFHLDSVYMILDEMVCNGQIVETNKRIVLGEASKFETKLFVLAIAFVVLYFSTCIDRFLSLFPLYGQSSNTRFMCFR